MAGLSKPTSTATAFQIKILKLFFIKPSARKIDYQKANKNI